MILNKVITNNIDLSIRKNMIVSSYKKYHLRVKDGYIFYPIKINFNPKCICSDFKSRSLCPHIFLALKRIYNINDYAYYLLPKYYTDILDNLMLIEEGRLDRSEHLKEIKKIYNDIECSICIEPLVKNDIDLCSLHQCDYCFNFLHIRCFHRLLQQDKNCPSCRNEFII